MMKFEQTQSAGQKPRFLSALIMAACFIIPTTHAKAQSAACAADFMTQMQNNAFLEAERRVLISNTLIRKPDSVLEYTCFDQRAALVAEDLGPIFSESDAWNNQTVSIGGGVGDDFLTPTPSVTYSVNMGSTHLDDSINALVLGAIKSYIDGSFDHKFLGGAATGSDNNFKSTVSAVEGTCDFLSSINKLSRCEDFSDDAPFTNDFAALTSLDPRTRPASCGSTHKITTTLIEEANNKNFGTTSVDQVDAYLTYFHPQTSGSACGVADPIPTGVMIEHREYGRDISGNTTVISNYDYQDKVCPTPGCYFDHGGDASETNDTCKP